LTKGRTSLLKYGDRKSLIHPHLLGVYGNQL